MKKKEKLYTFKEFKQFLAKNCWDERIFGEGRYDRKIYNWFDVGKPKEFKLFKINKNFKKLRKN